MTAVSADGNRVWSIGFGITVYALLKVAYDANSATNGIIPFDSNSYWQGATVAVLDNAGELSKDGYSFADWNTKSDGSALSYQAGSSFTMGSSNVSLYAKWIILSYGLFATGGNWYGQFGNGTNSNRSTPVQVMENVQSVSAGYYHTMILYTEP